MPANKAQFVAKLSENTGLSTAQAEAVTNALPETLGEWLKEHGADAPGSFVGEIDGGLRLELTRTPIPTPHWNLGIELTATGLDDFGEGSGRFGLPVENA